MQTCNLLRNPLKTLTFNKIYRRTTVRWNAGIVFIVINIFIRVGCAARDSFTRFPTGKFPSHGLRDNRLTSFRIILVKRNFFLNMRRSNEYCSAGTTILRTTDK